MTSENNIRALAVNRGFKLSRMHGEFVVLSKRSGEQVAGPFGLRDAEAWIRVRPTLVKRGRPQEHLFV